MLMSIDEYRKTFFTKNSAPCRQTVVNWILDGHLTGSKIGRIWFVKLGEDDNAPLRIETVKEKPTSSEIFISKRKRVLEMVRHNHS